MASRGETVTVIEQAVTGQDALGNDVLGDVETDVGGAVVWPTGSSELVQGQDTVTADLNVLVPPTAPVQVTATCRMRVRGEVYEVTGTPGDWRSPFTRRRPGLLVQLTRITG
jgi:hypothetical protein